MNLEKLSKIALKKRKIVIGLMSGTSLDGVDAALVEIKNNGANTKLKLLEFVSPAFPKGLAEVILKNSIPGGGRISEICRLNALLPLIYADAVKKLLAKAKFPPDKVDLIGSHGQTIHHLPSKEKYFGHSFGSTLQIGDPAALAKLTGIITIGDFRTGDVALGGQGAPLIPYFDYIMFRSASKNRALLNIGGISNFTIIKKKSATDELTAFDAGPGNMLSDFLAGLFWQKKFDKNGATALSGTVNPELFNELVSKDIFINAPPPKSTGREYYNSGYVDWALKKYNRLNNADFLATVSMLTPFSVYKNYESHIKAKTTIDELIVSGGGAKNKFFIKHLKELFGKSVSVKNINEFGLSSDAKEAVCFAVFANECVSGNPVNLPGVTGAKRKTILGKICLP
jgi:anhydro-N-acetylmuramic acid kinase